MRAHGFGPAPLFRTLLAEDSGPIGLALFFPHYSTTRGAPGAYVQDLWVAPTARGRGISARLLAAVARRAGAAWGARYLALAVHRSNPRAAAFYAGLGFHPADAVQPMLLQAAEFDALAAREGTVEAS